MNTRVKQDDGVFIESESDADRPRGCSWDETVCTAAPTHRIMTSHGAGDDAHVHADTLCGRHYALSLVRLAQVHAPGCANPLSQHVDVYGPVE